MQDQIQETLPVDASPAEIDLTEIETLDELPEEHSITEQLESLVNTMPAYKSQLLGIIEFCQEEKTAEEINEMLEPLREHRVCTYSPINLRTILVGAGALVYHDNDEEDEEITDENGNLVIPEQTSIPTWVAAEEALAFCASLNPYADLLEALENDDEFVEVYAHVLKLCTEEGSSISTIEHSINDSGKLEDTIKQPGYFVGKLEDLGAIEWKGAWCITPLGLQYLESSTEA